MSNSYFSFKKFTIYHNRCAMKVGTDGVLLGAWTNISHSQHILDIGTGTGLIALMLAQRCEYANVTAIDIDEKAIEQATENILSSPWNHRVQATLQDIRTYNPIIKFDTIVSNPPFFINSLKGPDNQRNMARHTETLGCDILLEKVAEILDPNGCFSIIIPAEQTTILIQKALLHHLYPSRHTAVITRPGLAPKRALIEFQKQQKKCHKDELTIEIDRHVYSEDYINLTKDFYLKM